MFTDWCDIDETSHGDNKHLYRISEKPEGRATVKDELIARVRSHYDKLDQISDDIEQLGYPGASAILKERMPQTPRARSGEMGEILATEFFELHTGFRIPVRRLRYKDGREMALRGDDFLGVNQAGAEEPLLFLKGESKSRHTLPNTVVTDARQRLSADDGRPTPISLLFVADRLLEAEDEGEQILGRRIRHEVALNSVPNQQITHGLFALTGNAAEDILEADLDATDNLHSHISANFHVDGHQGFIADIFEEAGNLGDD